MHKMAFAHVFGPEKNNGFGPFSYKFFVCIRVGLRSKGSSDVPGKVFCFRNQQIVKLCGVACRVAVIGREPAADGMGYAA